MSIPCRFCRFRLALFSSPISKSCVSCGVYIYTLARSTPDYYITLMNSSFRLG